MVRYIDTVMIGSDRVDERARLIARLCDLLEPLVGDLGPDTRGLVRGALLATICHDHDRPLDVVAEVLAHLADAVGDAVAWRRPGFGPGAGMAMAACDGRGVTDFAFGAATGVDRDEVAMARDEARESIGLPPAPASCVGRHPEGDDRACVPCVLVRADMAIARPRVRSHLGRLEGVVLDRVLAAATSWEEAVRRQGIQRLVDAGGPSPWTAIVGLSA